MCRYIVHCIGIFRLQNDMIAWAFIEYSIIKAAFTQAVSASGIFKLYEPRTTFVLFAPGDVRKDVTIQPCYVVA